MMLQFFLLALFLVLSPGNIFCMEAKPNITRPADVIVLQKARYDIIGRELDKIVERRDKIIQKTLDKIAYARQKKFFF